MNAWKYEVIFRVEQDISTREINFTVSAFATLVLAIFK